MKNRYKVSGLVFAIFGAIAAGNQLVQAAQVVGTLQETDQQISAPESPGESTAAKSVPLSAMSPEEQLRHQDQIDELRKQYGDEMLPRLVFTVEDDKLRIVGFYTKIGDATELSAGGPSCT